MDRKHNSKIVPFAKELRKNMTKEERHLWYDFLREYPVKFTRQKVLGKYIADFYCAKASIIIELDGSQHYEDLGLLNDEKRTEYLEQFGIKVIRISNLDVLKNFEGVCMHIDNVIKQSLSQLC
ncbi:MAG: endonuclease domain-containing protein [Ruminococcaceae bacterium]|nr:endonuclease domain-containing protein [Oscillospiraceae bacterium]